MPSLRHGAFVLAAASVLAGCWGSQPRGSLVPSNTPDARPSLGTPSAAPGDGLAACPNFVEVVETGPMPGDDGTEEGPVAREQERIRDDVDAASAYGAEHPDEFASVRFENGPRVRLVIGFTAHIAEHCAALREILEYPDEFEIIRQPA
ncbi:MAG TPA: hypothetical protein VFX65_06840, partial [Candidatus Limnocylindrales bacterium]|nr:hypothetical protein [Candidatus Limnocylindrales bacterium]